MFSRVTLEPVLVTTFVASILNLAVVFGLDLSDVQTAAILTVLNGGLAFFVRSKVSPVASLEYEGEIG